MREYKKEFQRKFMALDVKPKGKWRRAIEGSNRVKARKEIAMEEQRLLREELESDSKKSS